MSPLLPAGLAAVIAASVVLPVQACLTSEIDSEQVDSHLALSAAQCHLEAAAANPAEALVHAQYAYSWFAQAEQLQAGSAAAQLQQVRQRLQEIETQSHQPALTAQVSGH